MVKKIILVAFLSTLLFPQDVYEKNCLSCHRDLPINMQEIFKKYLLVYSGEKNVKASIAHYLKYPSSSISVMSNLFVDTYGIKKKTRLNERDLKKAVDIYWKKYNVFGKLE